jgi:uncharacterized protein
MTSPATDSPAAMDIPKRDLRFDLEGVDLRRWHSRGLHVSHFYNALSIFFPEGEAFFIDAVRHYADRVRSPNLREELAGFLGQEAMHSREHRRYNAALAAAGIPVKELEGKVVAHLDFVRANAPAIEQLAATIALEHFTAIMADVMLSDDRHLAGADPRMAAIWRWHAIEETEHKAVAFDVYREIAGEGFGAWLRRSTVMLFTTRDFWSRVLRYHFRLVREHGGTWDLRGWAELVSFLWIRPGGMWRMWWNWASYFRPSFHPWDHDNREHVERWKAARPAAGGAPAG